jgi:hypothetical protein
MFPDFLGIGAQKAGTTWLYRNLQTHPDVWLPREKELHYFDEKVDGTQSLRTKLAGEDQRDDRWRRQLRRQIRTYRTRRSLSDVRWDLHYFFGPVSDRWYASLFDQGQGKVTGEITPSYSTLGSERVAHVRRLMPKVKVLFFTRNPIERAWSHAAMAVEHAERRGGEVEGDLSEHFRSESSRLRTDYMRTIDVWSSHFPPEQLFVGFLEDVRFSPRELLARICAFLGVEPQERWPYAESRIHGGSADAIPVRLAAELAELHAPLLEALAERFGGHADWWRYCAERLRERSGGTGELPIPLLDSPLWKEWNAGRVMPGPDARGLQSAPLAELDSLR